MQENIEIIPFPTAINKDKDLKIIITTFENNEPLHKKLLEYVKETQIVNIAKYVKSQQPKQPQVSPVKAEFDRVNRIYTNGLRGLNDEKFYLKKPEDMPEHAKQLVAQLKAMKEAFLNGENFYIDKDKTMLAQDLFNRGYYKGVRRLGGYGSHLVNLGKKSSFEIEKIIQNVTNFSNYLNNKNITFLYMRLPNKQSLINLNSIEGMNNSASINVIEFFDGITNNGVNTIDYSQIMIDNEINLLESFFKTDGHWTPKTAFNATRYLCKELDKIIDIDIDWSKLDIKNYNQIVYPDIFLGNQGKKTGVFYSGLDDFELLLPKYDTDYTWIDPTRGFTKSGPADYSLMYPLQLDWKYNFLNPYAVYSLVHENLTIIKNHKSKSNLKILIFNDSFSNPISTFLAPHFSELYFLDLRGETKDILKILDEIKPDIVTMIYATFMVNIFPDLNYN